MRIVIDLQGAQTASRYRGIGRYTMALTRGILNNAGEHEIWLVLNGALDESIAPLRAEFEALVPRQRIQVFDVPGRVGEIDPDAAPRCRAAEILREAFIAALMPDVVLLSSLFEGYLDDAVVSIGSFIDGIRTAAVLYDLIPLLNPEAYIGAPPLRQFYMRKVDSLKRAGLLLSISDYAREEAISTLDLAPHKVVAISSAVSEDFVPAEPTPAKLAATWERFGITRPFVMCAPGGYDSRKNLAGLVTAYALLPPTVRAAHQLLIASHLSDHDRRQLETHALRQGLAHDELILTGYVSDAELVLLYQAASLFVLPSLHEGFGLPALEAMACGTPVIGSNRTSIPEVIGLDEAMFDPTQPQSIAGRIAAVLGDAALRERLRTHAYVQVRKFSWDQTAQRALRALEAHVAATPTPVLRSRGALLQALTGLPALYGNEQTLVQLALCLAALPNPSTPRQLLVDAGHAASVGPALLHSLSRCLPPGMVAAPVFLSAQGGVWHYRYGYYDAGQVADLRTGDLLLTLASAPNSFAAACADGLYAHLRRIGVTLHFVADASAPSDPTDDILPLALLTHADHILCMDEGTASALQAQRSLLPSAAQGLRIDFLDICDETDGEENLARRLCASLLQGSP